jgi:hypothetical protein
MRINWKIRICAGLITICGCLPLFGQSGTNKVAWSGSVRSRLEFWDWFEANANSDYAFSGSTVKLGARRQMKNMDWQIELEAPVLLGLPDDAIAPGAQGQLGLGATYYAAKDDGRNRAMIFPKQAFIRFKNLDPQGKQSLRIGRMEFSDGAETTPANATLAALKRDRISQRILGPFGFTHVGRSFDGINYVYTGKRDNITFLGAVPTRGAFQVDGWGNLPIGVFYGAYTRSLPGKQSAGDLRLFGMYYHDWRAVLKTDNRPLAVRRADADKIGIGMIGAHYLRSQETAAGNMDLLFWGVWQGGSWGLLDHRAEAASVEAGFQPAVLKNLKPWIRFGAHHGSGDSNPVDNKHETFFQVLPTARVYARFPFYNLMNNQDAFAELILRPHSKLSLRSDFHWLRLAHSADLWYQGGGAYQPWTFGYSGRASNGNRGLARLFDISGEWQVSPRATAGIYYAHVQGAQVTESIYPSGKNANYAFLEVTYKF